MAIAPFNCFPGNDEGRWWYFEQAKFTNTASVFPWLPKAFDIWQKGRRGFSSQGRVWKDGLEGVLTPYPLKMTCGFLIQPLICKLCGYVWYVLSAVHIMLLPSQKPSSYSLLNFVQATRQLRQSLVLYCGAPPPKKNPGSTKKKEKNYTDFDICTILCHVRLVAALLYLFPTTFVIEDRHS